MKLVPYESWHYEFAAGHSSAPATMGWDAIRLLSLAYAFRGDSFSVQHENRIIGCLGIMELWPGVGEVWSMMTPELRSHPYYLHRNTKRILQGLIEKRNYHRVQAEVRAANPVAVKWIEKLGFEYESTLEKYGADQSDHFMYVRIGRAT